MHAYIRRQKITITALGILLGSVGSLLSPALAAAAPLSPTTTSVVAADVCADANRDNASAQLDATKKQQAGTKCLIKKYINPAVAFLSALAGVAVVISIIVGAIQYSSAGGDPGKVTAARNHIVEAVVSLLAFVFLYAFLNFLLPGGLSGTGK